MSSAQNSTQYETINMSEIKRQHSKTTLYDHEYLENHPNGNSSDLRRQLTTRHDGSIKHQASRPDSQSSKLTTSQHASAQMSRQAHRTQASDGFIDLREKFVSEWITAESFRRDTECGRAVTEASRHFEIGASKDFHSLIAARGETQVRKARDGQRAAWRDRQKQEMAQDLAGVGSWSIEYEGTGEWYREAFGRGGYNFMIDFDVDCA